MSGGPNQWQYSDDDVRLILTTAAADLPALCEDRGWPRSYPHRIKCSGSKRVVRIREELGLVTRARIIRTAAVKSIMASVS